MTRPRGAAFVEVLAGQRQILDPLLPSLSGDDNMILSAELKRGTGVFFDASVRSALAVVGLGESRVREAHQYGTDRDGSEHGL